MSLYLWVKIGTIGFPLRKLLGFFEWKILFSSSAVFSHIIFVLCNISFESWDKQRLKADPKSSPFLASCCLSRLCTILDSSLFFLIVGSLAVKNKETTSFILEKNENKIYIALDILKKNIMISGWIEESNVTVDEIIEYYNSYPIKGFIFTDISRDGMLSGLNIDLIGNFLVKTKKDVVVGGGLSNYDDLQNLIKINSNNLEGVIAGKSFYSGNIKILKALEILNSNA